MSDCFCSSSNNICCINDRFLSLRSSVPNNMSNPNFVKLSSPSNNAIGSIVHVISYASRRCSLFLLIMHFSISSGSSILFQH